MLWSVRDLFSMAQAAQVYFKIYRQWQVSKSNNGVAVNYNPGLSIFIPSLGASRRNYCLLSPIGMKLPKIAKEQALIPYIKLGCFSDVLEGFPWVTLRRGKKRKTIHRNTAAIVRCRRLNMVNNYKANHVRKCKLNSEESRASQEVCSQTLVSHQH